MINLLDHQIDHVQKIDEIYKHDNFYLDCSVMGSGKTYVALHFAKKYNLSLFVICPKSMINTWRTTADTFKIPIIDVITYQSLRGRNKKSTEYYTLSHPYLERMEGFEMFME